MNARTFAVAALVAWSFSCKEEAAQPANTTDAKLPIVVYYSLPG